MKPWKDSVSSIISTPLFYNIKFWVCPPQILCVVVLRFQKHLKEEALK